MQAIERMVDEDVPCEDILAQINAVKSALHKVGQVVLEGHIQHCVRDGIEHGDADQTIVQFTAGAEKRCFVRSSFCFSDFEKLLLTTNTPIGIQGGNSVKKLEEFLELGRNEEGHHAGMRRQEQKAFRLPCVNRLW